MFPEANSGMHATQLLVLLGLLGVGLLDTLAKTRLGHGDVRKDFELPERADEFSLPKWAW